MVDTKNISRVEAFKLTAKKNCILDQQSKKIQINNKYKRKFNNLKIKAVGKIAFLLMNKSTALSLFVKRSIKFISKCSPVRKKMMLRRASLKKRIFKKSLVSSVVSNASNYVASGSRVACILDDFSYATYSPEADLVQLTPSSWEEEMELLAPGFLFVESAWRGKDGLWEGKINHLSNEIVDLIGYCNKKHIPTVFWNKEDPYHLEEFIDTASLFGHVMTTDVSSIDVYKQRLCHENVHLMLFSVQPKYHNPIEKYNRKDALVFAGAYYNRFPKRKQFLYDFMINFIPHIEIDIFDRNYNDENSNHRFPEEYEPFIRGTLPYSEIEKGYKGYKYALNINSITSSKSMFSRRVIELMASNTLVISNESLAITDQFSELLISSDNASSLIDEFMRIKNDSLKISEMKLKALRKVLNKYTAKQSFKKILSIVTNTAPSVLSPKVCFVTCVRSDVGLAHVNSMYLCQKYENKSFLVVCDDSVSVVASAFPHIEFISENDRRCFQDVLSDVDYISGMAATDYYGEYYLTDLILATEYTDAMVIGKSAHYIYDNKLTVINKNKRYTYVDSMAARCSIINLNCISSMPLADWVCSVEELNHNENIMLAIDEFNYCKDLEGVRLQSDNPETISF